MNTSNIYNGRLVEITDIERYVLNGEEIFNYKLSLVKWGLFYKVGSSYIDLETFKSYKLTNKNKFHYLYERSIDPRSLSFINENKKHISYKQIKKILKQN